MSKRKDQENLSKLIEWLKEAQSVPKVTQKARKPPSTLNVLSRKLQSHIRSLEKGIQTAEQVREIESNIPLAYREVLKTQLHFLGSLRAKYASNDEPSSSDVRGAEQLHVDERAFSRRLELDTASSSTSFDSPSLSDFLDLEPTTTHAMVVATRDTHPDQKPSMQFSFSPKKPQSSMEESPFASKLPAPQDDFSADVSDCVNFRQ